jgi:hypothetical protein
MNIRHLLFPTLLTPWSIVLPLSAQLVNESATRTLNSVTNTSTSAVTAGTNGAFTLLVLPQSAERVTPRFPESQWAAVTVNQRATERL